MNHIMLPRLSPFVLGASSRSRCYSSVGGAPGSNGSSGFLSDLMKRIDNINLKATKIANTPAAASPVERKKQWTPKTANAGKQNAGKQNVGKQNVAKQTKQPFVPNRVRQPVKAKIAVKDHPLSSNMFKLMDEKNFQSRGGQVSGRRAQGGEKISQNGQGPTRNQERGGKFATRSNARPNGRPQHAGAKRFGNKRPGITSKRSSPATPASIVPKKLQSAALKPAIGADQFLYGKPSKFAVSTSTRVAAVAKEFLLKSQYPYRLPKSIIDGVDRQFSGNRFLLQNDFKASVDAEQFQARVKQVVRGESEELSISKKATSAEKDTRRGLMENGSLSMDDKKTIYGVVAGLKSAQDLLKNAAWNK